MTMLTELQQKAVQDLLDPDLGADQRASAEAIVNASAEARRELDALRATADFARRRLGAGPVPESLRARIMLALDEEDRRASAPAQPAWTRLTAWGPGLAWAALLILLLAIGSWWLDRPHPIVAALEHEFHELDEGRMELVSREDAAILLKPLFEQWGMPYDPAVMDPGSTNLTFEGAAVHAFPGGQSFTVLFTCNEGSPVLCEMYIGEIPAMAGARTHSVGGRQVMLARRGEYSFAFWRDGKMICCICAERPETEVLQFALAKAGLL